MPGNERVSTVRDLAFGPSSSESFATRVHGSWLSRTSEDSLLGEAIVFSATLPTAGTMRNGRLYARATSAPLTSAPECSLWLTPNATPDATSNNGTNAGRPATGKSLAKQADGRWPTPRAENSESSGRREGRGIDDTLTAKVRATQQDWSTPTCRNKETLAKVTRGANVSAGGTPLLVQVQRWPTPTSGDSKGAGSRNLEGSKANAGVSLTDAVRFGNSTTPRQWMTPQSRDHKGISQKVAKGEFTGGLPDQLLGMQRGADGPPAPASPNTPGSRPASSSPLVLNPRWVLTLMGFPATYLDGVAPPSKPRATRSSPRWAPSSPAVSVS